MGPRHRREQIVEGAVTTALEEGLSRLTYGRVARRTATSDRVVAYYLPTVEALASTVLSEVGAALLDALAQALPEPVADHRELVRRAWPVLTTVQSERAFRLFLEASGLAVAGREPYATLLPQLVGNWLDWLTGRVRAAAGVDPAAEAGAALALVDGLVLVGLLAGQDAADRAARALGVLPG